MEMPLCWTHETALRTAGRLLMTCLFQQHQQQQHLTAWVNEPDRAGVLFAGHCQVA